MFVCVERTLCLYSCVCVCERVMLLQPMFAILFLLFGRRVRMIALLDFEKFRLFVYACKCVLCDVCVRVHVCMCACVLVC